MGESQRSVRHAAKMGALFVASLVLALSIPSIAFAALMPVYRFYNFKQGVHFYTADAAEKASVQANLSSTYSFDGVAYTIDTADPANSHPLYRFYNVVTGVHLYTADEAEKNNVIATLGSIYRFEGVAYNVSLDPSGAPVYRFYNPSKGVHFYTASEAEKNTVIATLGYLYRFEGVAFYLGHGTALDVTPPVTTTDALLNYPGPATITLSATDIGGSGVAHTYYKLDSGAQTTYTGAITVPGSALPLHLLEFWSVDNAGNTEVHQSVFFTMAQDISAHHALPVGLDCTTSGCHDTDVATIHVLQLPGGPTPDRKSVV